MNLPTLMEHSAYTDLIYYGKIRKHCIVLKHTSQLFPPDGVKETQTSVNDNTCER